MAAATWYLVKYMPDRRAREPRNVGVVMQTPVGWFSRFFAEQATGEVDGRHTRSLKLDVEVYRTWIDYYRRKMQADSWPDVFAHQARRTSNYYIELGGYYVEPVADWDAELRSLYSNVVRDPSAGDRPADVLRATVRQLIHHVQLPVEEDVSVDAQFGDRFVPVKFAYRFVNGSVHLMDTISLGGPQGPVQGRDFYSRAVAARESLGVDQFASFYNGVDVDPEHREELLAPLDAMGPSIDVSDFSEAADTLIGFTSH